MKPRQYGRSPHCDKTACGDQSHVNNETAIAFFNPAAFIAPAQKKKKRATFTVI